LVILQLSLSAVVSFAAARGESRNAPVPFQRQLARRLSIKFIPWVRALNKEKRCNNIFCQKLGLPGAKVNSVGRLYFLGKKSALGRNKVTNQVKITLPLKDNIYDLVYYNLLNNTEQQFLF
jgi:hypothetical protein